MTSTIYLKQDLLKSQKEIDALSDEELKALNDKVHNYAIEKAGEIRRRIQTRVNYLCFAIKMYKKLRKEKVEYPFWRCKGLVELVLMEFGLKADKITTGFTIVIGDVSKDLCSLVLKPKKSENDFFNEGFSSEIWYRTYNKTKVRTPEEQEIYDADIRARVKENYRKQWNRNCAKFNCKPEQFDKKFIDLETNEIYHVEGCRPRNKKMPIFCHKTDKNGNDLEYYCLTSRYFNSLKEMEEDNGC